MVTNNGDGEHLGIRRNGNLRHPSNNMKIPRRAQSTVLNSNPFYSRKYSMSTLTPRDICRSVDSRVFVDMSSPNFQTLEDPHRDEIINSVRLNYLNSSKRSSVSHGNEAIPRVNPTKNSSASTIAAANVDSDDDETNLSSAGGDITHDIYKLVKAEDPKRLRRPRSMENVTSKIEHHTKLSSASGLNVPGGFRREFIVNKKRQEHQLNDSASSDFTSHESDSINQSSPSSNQDIDKVPFLTRNFLEFLYVFGHFAGESFEDDFIPDSSNMMIRGEDERSALLSRPDHMKILPSAKGTTSTKKVFLILLKSFIGTGVLFLPNAFHNGGLFFSVSMLAFFGIYSYWCYYILVQAKSSCGVSSFGDIGLKLYGPWMRIIILFSLVITQVGFSGAYMIFTAKNLQAFLDNVFHVGVLPLSYLMVFQTIIFIPLSFIRNISKLSLPSLLANFFIMAGLVIVIIFTAKRLFFDLMGTPAMGVVYGLNADRWTLFIGTAIFAFEGIGLIIPVQDSMRNPEKFPLVLALVILTATILFISIATLGYLAYGSNVQTVILLNLPQSNIFVNLIQLFYSIAIMLSTPLQLFPAIKIIENKFFPKFTKIYVKHDDLTTRVELRPNSGKLNWKIKWLKNFIRSIIVIIVVSIAYFGSDNLDKFVSVIGSLACIPLVYIYPSMLHLRGNSLPETKGEFWRFKPMLDTILIFFGIASMLYTSYQSIFGV
ncbi:AMP_1a_G0045930.mRNA.1.CDS.1 [Saccharomyces cerevisiae]|nr:AMP_1a_G0045930.mRNA.1.CDS.1 [Saccharomyces cerevisiae]CAI6863083.1 AMP_1a_G0045930.mRNA.1.CDS.1 [Saccharomyces cerevisiae]